VNGHLPFVLIKRPLIGVERIIPQTAMIATRLSFVNEPPGLLLKIHGPSAHDGPSDSGGELST